MQIKLRPDVIKRVKQAAASIIEKKVDEIVTLAKQVVPVDTGALRDSISKKTSEDGTAFVISTNSGYGAYVEYGTYKMAAQPYLRTAIMETLGVAT